MIQKILKKSVIIEDNSKKIKKEERNATQKNKIKKKIDYSWDGGLKGYKIIVEFLSAAKIFLNLKKEHFIYCITSSRTDLIELNRIFINLGYKNRIVEKEHIFLKFRVSICRDPFNLLRSLRSPNSDPPTRI